MHIGYHMDINILNTLISPRITDIILDTIVLAISHDFYITLEII